MSYIFSHLGLLHNPLTFMGTEMSGHYQIHPKFKNKRANVNLTQSMCNDVNPNTLHTHGDAWFIFRWGDKKKMNLLQYLVYVSRTNSVKFTISQKIQKHPSKNTSSPCREQRTNPEYSKSLSGKLKPLWSTYNNETNQIFPKETFETEHQATTLIFSSAACSFQVSGNQKMRYYHSIKSKPQDPELGTVN